MNAAGVCRSQARAKIVRILHAVEQEHERRYGEALQVLHELTVVPSARGRDVGDDTLMSRISLQAVQLTRLRALHADTGLARQLLDFSRARIIAPALQPQLAHALGMAHEEPAKRVQPVDEVAFGHAQRLRLRPVARPRSGVSAPWPISVAMTKSRRRSFMSTLVSRTRTRMPSWYVRRVRRPTHAARAGS